MRRFLRGDVHAVGVGEALVVLDIARDEYLCLPFGSGDLSRHANGALTIEPGYAARALGEAGLLTSEPPQTPRRVPPKPSRTVIHERAPTGAGLADAASAIAAAFDVRNARRRGGVSSYLSLDVADDRSRDQSAVEMAAKWFWKVGPWLPLEGECLVRSATLMRFLARQGLSADWVFGVRLWPFMAHCWVQLEDACLNDDVERLVAYTPLMCR